MITWAAPRHLRSVREGRQQKRGYSMLLNCHRPAHRMAPT